MSLTGGQTTLLFCEGKPSSLDSQLLGRLVAGSRTLVVPSGGKYGLPAFIEGRISTLPDQPPFIAFCDRDFDAEPAEHVQLLSWPGPKPIFLTHRACIESYLLDPELMDAYWTESSRGPQWRHGPSPGKPALARWIQEAAREIVNYQVVRWALAKLKPPPRWPRVSTTWTRASGVLPQSLVYTDCLDEAANVVRSFREQISQVDLDRLKDNAKSFQKRFAGEEFWDCGQYLTWFHGKDLRASMQRSKKHSISIAHFFLWGIQRLDCTKHADLSELANKVM